MVLALCLWGLFAGVYYPAMNAILADSVETGGRTSVYTIRWMLQMVRLAVAGSTFFSRALTLVHCYNSAHLIHYSLVIRLR